jgi:hypothetical protein
MVYLQLKQSLGYQQHSFRLLLCIYTTGVIQSSQAFYIYMGTITMYNYTWRTPLAFISPCRFPFVSPFASFYLLGTLLAVTGSVHLGLRLLVN